MEFRKWQKIGQFHNARRSIRELMDYKMSLGESHEAPRVAYRAKIKLDGTNAAIRVEDGSVGFQSRSRMISVEDDNYGFAAFASNHTQWAQDVAGPDALSIYGEWCGLGIQRRCAVSRCERMFVVFAIEINGARVDEPEAICARLGTLPAGVFVLSWFEEPVVIDYAQEKALDSAIEQMCELVTRVEACDPWVLRHFGHEGMGEGLVYYPVTIERGQGLAADLDLMFKAKGLKHERVKQKSPVIKNPEVVASIAAFVDKFVTEARLEQGLEALGISTPSASDTGAFLKWLGNDVRSESDDERELAGLEWSDVAKSVALAAKTWLFQRV